MPRLLYVPMYSSPVRIGTDSTYNWAKLFFKTVVERDPEAFVYFPVPEGYSNKYEEVDHPRIFKFPVPMYGQYSQYVESGRLQEVYVEKFNELLGPYIPDIVVCDKASVLPNLQMGLDIWLPKARAPRAYLTKTHFIFDRDKIAGMGPELEVTQSVGYAQADGVLWMSQQDFERGYHVAQKYLSPYMLDKMRRTKLLGGWLANFVGTEMNEIDPSQKPRQPMTMSWAYGANTDYHVEEIMTIYDQVYKMTPGVRVLVTMSGGAGLTAGRLLRGMPYCETYCGLPQLEFFKKLRDAHVFIYWPTKPFTCPSTVMEQQQMGLVGVFPADERCPVHLYPGYPYKANGVREMMHMTKWLMDHYFDDSVQEVIRKQREFNKAQFDPRDDSWRMYQHALAAIETKGKQIRGKRAIVELLHRVTAGLPEVSLDQVVNLFRRESRIGLNLNDIGALTHALTCRGQVRWLMRYAGMRDACDRPEVVFVRKEDGYEWDGGDDDQDDSGAAASR